MNDAESHLTLPFGAASPRSLYVNMLLKGRQEGHDFCVVLTASSLPCREREQFGSLISVYRELVVGFWAFCPPPSHRLLNWPGMVGEEVY